MGKNTDSTGQLRKKGTTETQTSGQSIEELDIETRGAWQAGASE